MQTNYAIIVSDFNNEITHALRDGAVTRLHDHGVIESQIKIVHVPGAIEIPLTAALLAKSQKFSAIICLGAVIKGETDHYDYVCQQVSYGCQQAMLQYQVPVIFGILTTSTYEQALDRIGGKHGHKGEEAANAAIQMVNVIKCI